ncbi:hypothetical protein QWY20_16255 [Alkalimonas sp. MEB108]|uniref:Lipoprotein n=1 Tax=Alkalimonas cellulosilytica TaxID=3058395 RepID=A0ABU7J961_9GAMM|nr:hypothetical protein [Alkalimonas sp. MEB108]MEE2003012.1 hypothetical protein [Alkalimonas sp. MEB108]
MNKKHTRFTLTTLPMTAAVIATLLASGCSSSPEQRLAKLQQAEYEQRVKDRNQSFRAAPDWYLQSEVSTLQGTLGRGTSFSRDMQAAVDNAMLMAQLELARNTQALVSEQVKMHRRNNLLTGESRMLLETTADRYLPEVDVAGSTVLNREIIRERDGFRAYILLHLDVAERDQERMAQAAMDRAHRELMERNARYRAEQAALAQ